MQIAKYLVAAGLTVLWASCAWAGIYTAPLDGLKGVYSTGELGPAERTAVFDFGMKFERIVSVRVHLTGTIAPALFRDDRDLEHVIDSQITPYMNVSIQAIGQPAHAFGFLDPKGAFDAEASISHPIFDPESASWHEDFTFLSTGTGTVDVLLGPIGSSGFSRQIVPALAGITGAYVILDGVAASVPEPSVILWTMIGAMMFVSRRRGGR